MSSPNMQVWIVVYEPTSFTEDLYQAGLQLVDPNTQARIKRFYRRDDACRRLLPRMLLKERGVARKQMIFGSTETNKPYIASPDVDPPIAYNISHDNALVAMAFTLGKHLPPAYQVGVDVMKVQLPKRETFLSFVQTFRDQLTIVEQRVLFGVSPEEGIRRFYWIWTMKEAYTKALGLGLGFDFSRIEYNVPEDVVIVDGVTPKGWQFIKFELDVGPDTYVGVAAECVGENDACSVVWASASQLTHYDAASFVRQGIAELN